MHVHVIKLKCFGFLVDSMAMGSNEFVSFDTLLCTLTESVLGENISLICRSGGLMDKAPPS